MSLITIKHDLGSLQRDLISLGDRAPLVMARALNRAGVAGRTAMVRAIAQDTGIASSAVAKNIVLDKASKTLPRVVVTAFGRRIPLIDFGARGPEPSRGRGKGVSYRVGASRNRVPNAFIATMPSGHRGVFKRLRKSRLPVIELFGPSIPHVFERFLPVFEERSTEVLVTNLVHEIGFAQGKFTEAA